jgi:hypothetical protein
MLNRPINLLYSHEDARFNAINGNYGETQMTIDTELVGPWYG